MANWKYVLDFSPFYEADISIQEKAKKVYAEIGRVFVHMLNPDDENYDNDLYTIGDEFGWFTENDNDDVEEFDNLMEDLYDWADQEVAPRGEWPPNKMCWVKTI